MQFIFGQIEHVSGMGCMTSSNNAVSSHRQIVCFKATEGLQPPLYRAALVNSRALLALLRWELCPVFTRLVSALRVATLYDFSVTLQHA
jgi:hypothetical protein